MLHSPKKKNLPEDPTKATGRNSPSTSAQQKTGQTNTAYKQPNLPLSSNEVNKINLDPENQIVNTENDWQTVPILRRDVNRYKRKRVSGSPESDTPVRNQYAGLQVDEEPINNGTQKTQVSKPPPIVLYGINDIAKLCEVIDKTLQKSQYTFKIVTKNQLRISCDTIDSYKKLMCLTREKGLIGHTFTRKDERPYRIVIKDLHPSTPVEAIKEEIESTGNTIVGEIINARYGPEKTPTYTWFVNLAPHPKNAEIKKLKYIYHTSVKIEDPRRTSTIAQCKRCQQYGHTRNYCMRPYRCVKCAEDHNTTDCPKKDRTTPAKCALCLGDHPANYRGCKVRLEIQKRKMSRPQLKRQQTETNKTTITGKDFNTNFPTTENIPPRENYRSYADATIGNKNPTNCSNLETILSKQAEKLDRLIDQMGVLMGLLTTIVTKLIP
ncbi:unnamed protein product [Plutella xylostella]|uniref:(diamondback moth) hypothetical protein n=1 Tax=Plutella xylostella TaxID=51655 RepID=A0A8S4D1K7_PLUXY|nr:unnamed protein product [Plutella xylostella]